jgi:alkanesulfonate monooxygenase SsuD/methylene tetrahydromethanopterin reductase-like flavin-dependent oxidoreductase (luciferase family)
MKFGFAAMPIGVGGRSDRDAYHAAMEDVALGVDLGYDSVWVLEHHFTPYFPVPDPLQYLTQVAARYPTIGLGTAVIVAPWHNPIRLTEQIATLNNISQGPLHIGMGRGTAKYEFDRFQRDMTETRQRFKETVEIIRLGLAGKPFTYEGEHFRIPETTIRPFVDDISRIHLSGAIASPESARVMGELKLPLIQALFFPDAKAREVIGLWRDTARAAGMDVDAEMDLPFLGLPTVVAKTDEAAREIARKYYPIFAKVQAQHYETASDPWKDLPSFERHSRNFTNMAKLAELGPHFEYFLDLQLIGSPETVIRRIEQLQDALGINNICSVHALYEMEDDLRRQSMRLMAEEIAPHFRKKTAAA